MAEWKNEDDIKAELRGLTDDLKRLREELRDMVAPPKPNPSRAFLHRQALPPARREQVAAHADDRKRTAASRRTPRPGKKDKDR